MKRRRARVGVVALLALGAWSSSLAKVAGVRAAAPNVRQAAPVAGAACDLMAAPPAVRLAQAQALAGDASVRGVRLLYLLSHDPAPEVVEAAAAAAVARCAEEAASVCRSILPFFLRDGDGPASLLARERLRALAPLVALKGASRAFRRDTVAYLAARLHRPEAPADGPQALRLLAEDPDLATQEAATAALYELER